jgi:NADPH:quinone reductase-like Zn-dependent oxidoreductase
MAKIAVVPQFALAEYPARLSYEEGTAIWMQYLTAYGGLIMLGQLTKGDFALITAASSSVGIAAIEIAKAEGAISIAVTRTASKKAALLKLGADHVIVTDEEDLVERVKEITAGKGARIIFDPIGGKIVEALAAAAAPKGIIFEYGALAPEPTPYPLFTALSKFLTIRAYTLFELAADPEQYAKARKYIAAGNFNPLIDKTFPFSEIEAAHRYMESNAQVGKIVITV